VVEPVTVKVYVPAGVPGSVVPPPPPPPPPPHPANVAATSAKSIIPNANFGRRFRVEIVRERTNRINAPPPVKNQSGRLNRPETVCGPVVVTVSVALPLVVREAGFNVQVASLMLKGTVQFKLTVPVNPGSEVDVIVVVPDWPGTEMLMLVGFNERLNPGMTVTVTVVDEEAA
jgi:hypothetical protein